VLNTSGNVQNLNYPTITVIESDNNGGDGVRISDGFAGNLRLGQITVNGGYGVNLLSPIGVMTGGTTEGNSSGAVNFGDSATVGVFQGSFLEEPIAFADRNTTTGGAPDNSKAFLMDVDQGTMRGPSLSEANRPNTPQEGELIFNPDRKRYTHGQEKPEGGKAYRTMGPFYGSYTGDGTQGRTIDVGVRPVAVIIRASDGTTYDVWQFDDVIARGVFGNDPAGQLGIADNGISIGDNGADADPNTNGETYRYIVI
jgi:hypothetical protein